MRSDYQEPLYLLQIVLQDRHRGAAEVDPRLERAILPTVNGLAAGLPIPAIALSRSTRSIGNLKHRHKSGNLSPSTSLDGYGSMSTVLDDVTNEKIDAQHIRRRVEDWDTRLQALYDMIGGWLPEGWTAHEGAPVRMHEELMRESGVDPKQVPTLELVSQTGVLQHYSVRNQIAHGRLRSQRIDVSRVIEEFHQIGTSLARN